MSPPNAPAADSFGESASIRIELAHTNPPIWREVEAPTSITLKVLHDIIQASIGWFDYHLWEFTIVGRRYGLPMDEDWGTEPRKDATKVRLREVLKPDRTVIDYLYDFGDSWEHRITVTKVRQGDPDIDYPRYLGGRGAGPPEDCGGIPGFYELLEARADPDHPEHIQAVEWLDDHDPDEVEVLPIKYALARIAARRNAAKTRLGSRGAHRMGADNRSVLYLRVPKLFDELALAHGDGSFTRRLKSLAAAELLILDDWGLEPLGPQARHDLLEILEDRYDRRSTLVTSQVPVADWHTLIGHAT